MPLVSMIHRVIPTLKKLFIMSLMPCLQYIYNISTYFVHSENFIENFQSFIHTVFTNSILLIILWGPDVHSFKDIIDMVLIPQTCF
jgi:hypothetical protein